MFKHTAGAELISSEKESARASLVVGLGVSGWSCVRFLAGRGLPVTVTDSRNITPYSSNLRRDYPDIVCSLGAFDSALFDEADEIIVSPGVPLDTPEIEAARDAGKSIIGDIELFSRYAAAPIAAITGSNGKSTVTALLGEMAKAAGVKTAVGGNIGTPALDLLAQDPELFVLELSSFQLALTSSLQTETAVVLNVSADHMDRHPSMLAYARTKFSIYNHCRRPVVNSDFIAATQNELQLMSEELSTKASNYSLAEPVFDSDFGVRETDGTKYLAHGGQNLLPVSALSIAGQHNVSNALAALAMGSILNLPEEAMQRALVSFAGLPHRCERVAVIDDITFINDSKGTNVGATVTAVKSIDGPLVLIAGGDAKGADLSPLRAVLAGKARVVITMGKDADQVEASVRGVTETVRVNDMNEAVKEAFVHSEPGDTVLLSPACSSLDMFSNYEERGHAFVKAVRGFHQ